MVKKSCKKITKKTLHFKMELYVWLVFQFYWALQKKLLQIQSNISFRLILNWTDFVPFSVNKFMWLFFDTIMLDGLLSHCKFYFKAILKVLYTTIYFDRIEFFYMRLSYIKIQDFVKNGGACLFFLLFFGPKRMPDGFTYWIVHVHPSGKNIWQGFMWYQRVARGKSLEN